MKRTRTLAAALALAGACLSGPAHAEPIFPAGAYPEVDALMARHARQFYFINAVSMGLSLDAHVNDADRALIDQFLAQSASDDFESVTGKHPFETLSRYGEHGDLGFFGGVALAGTAYEYMTLKRDGTSDDELARARARVVRAANAWHVFYRVTGGDGIVARGIRRLRPEDPSDPPLPGVPPETIPLTDADGNPQPPAKTNGTWRDDNSGGELPAGEYLWVDSCSKDQLVGQVFAMVALYDAMVGDPDIDQALVERMRADALGTAEMLMTKREISELVGAVGSGEYDLIIMDADGRPTRFHDINPLSLEKIYLQPDDPSFNLFNLVMAAGVMKGLHHVSGDERIERFLYEDLYAERGFLDKITRWRDGVDFIYLGLNTNFDNPDMMSLALWLTIYLENDPEVTTVMREFLETSWWQREGESHTARLAKQPLWHAIYMTLTDRGVDQTLPDELADYLGGFSLGPYWDVDRFNCDDAEIAAGECLAIDGKTMLTLDGMNSRGNWMATEALHPSIRPTSNFDARSNPFEVNSGGSDRLNPGGDLMASYWFARFMQKNPAGEVNVSPQARDHIPVGGGPRPGGGGEKAGDEGGCGCRVTAPGNSGVGWLAALLTTVGLARRRPRRA